VTKNGHAPSSDWKWGDNSSVIAASKWMSCLVAVQDALWIIVMLADSLTTGVPSGKHTKNFGKSPCLMGKSL
jgi:hypothetical protein